MHTLHFEKTLVLPYKKYQFTISQNMNTFFFYIFANTQCYVSLIATISDAMLNLTVYVPYPSTSIFGMTSFHRGCIVQRLNTWTEDLDFLS